MLHTPENTEAFIAAEAVPVDATASDVIDERTVRLNSLLGEAAVVISPADTGYDLEVADAFYRALAEVLGGRTSADDAATQLAATGRVTQDGAALRRGAAPFTSPTEGSPTQ